MQLERRHFMAWGSAAAAWIAAHASGMTGAAKVPQGRSRIVTLELLTAAPLEALRSFYHEALGFPVVEQQADRLAFATGASLLAFSRTAATAEENAPFYHFAFNIPENKILAARSWQLERGSLMPIPARLRDAAYPDDVVNFRHWNAHSIFFIDPAGNVVEYIARHDLDNASTGPFTTRDILYASEIGLVVDDVATAAAQVGEVAGVGPYRGGDEQFRAMGDEYGLLLILRRGRPLNLDPDHPAKQAAVYRTAVHLRGPRATKFELPGFPYTLTATAKG